MLAAPYSPLFTLFTNTGASLLGALVTTCSMRGLCSRSTTNRPSVKLVSRSRFPAVLVHDRPGLPMKDMRKAMALGYGSLRDVSPLTLRGSSGVPSLLHMLAGLRACVSMDGSQAAASPQARLCVHHA